MMRFQMNKTDNKSDIIIIIIVSEINVTAKRV